MVMLLNKMLLKTILLMEMLLRECLFKKCYYGNIPVFFEWPELVMNKKFAKTTKKERGSY